jgi:hypothetical protein
VECNWIGGAVTEGDYCRKPYDGFLFNCEGITNMGSCTSNTNGKCYWEPEHCEDA